ncbi:MAG: class D sortase [Terriglobales bacterium]
MKSDSPLWQEKWKAGLLVQRVREFFSIGRTRQGISPALLLLGALLLIYVGVQYGEMYLEQRHLAREWQRQQEARQPGSPRRAASARGGLEERPASAAAKAQADDDGLTRLSVPKIDLDSVVVEGTNRQALLLGPGHMKETPAPGETGNSVITGHRDTFFRHIHELEKGDTVVVQRDGKTYRYQVVGKKIVAPDDLSVIRPVRDSQLTLITCYPTYYIGPAPKRLVVFSKLVDDNGGQAQAAAAGH